MYGGGLEDGDWDGRVKIDASRECFDRRVGSQCERVTVVVGLAGVDRDEATNV